MTAEDERLRQLNVQVPESVVIRLRVKAARERTTIAAIVREFLELMMQEGEL